MGYVNYGENVSLYKTNTSDIELMATRLSRYAEAILEAQALGYGPGSVDQIWKRDFNERALPVYSLTLSWNYLSEIASRFKIAASFMVVIGPPIDIGEDWIIVTEFLRQASSTIDSLTPSSLKAADCQLPFNPIVPSVMRFELLANIASEEGAERLRSASDAVATALVRAPEVNQVHNPLSLEEIMILQRLAGGESSVDIAYSLGYDLAIAFDGHTLCDQILADHVEKLRAGVVLGV